MKGGAVAEAVVLHIQEECSDPCGHCACEAWDAAWAMKEDCIRAAMDRARLAALEALSRYKFLMFGYHAAVWVNLNRLLDEPEPNPFRELVKLAREENHHALLRGLPARQGETRDNHEYQTAKGAA